MTFNEVSSARYINRLDVAWIVDRVSDISEDVDEFEVFCDGPDVDTVMGAIEVAKGWELAESRSFDEWLSRKLEDENAFEEEFDEERAAGDTVLRYRRDGSPRPVSPFNVRWVR